MAKDPRRQLQGAVSRARGKQFENRLDETFAYYAQKGFAAIEKTPEPMRVLKSTENGRFLCCFEKKAQPDYTGTMKGGRAIKIEAKYTDKDRIEQSRVLPIQVDYMDRHERLGARCYVVVGFSSGNVYRVPWSVWDNMKQYFGHKYATEAELEKYLIPAAWNGVLMLLD